MSSMSSFAGFKFTFTHFAYFLGLKLPPNTSSLSWLAGAAGNPQDFEVGNGGSREKLYSHVEYVYNAGRCEISGSQRIEAESLLESRAAKALAHVFPGG